MSALKPGFPESVTKLVHGWVDCTGKVHDTQEQAATVTLNTLYGGARTIKVHGCPDVLYAIVDGYYVAWVPSQPGSVVMSHAGDAGKPSRDWAIESWPLLFPDPPKSALSITLLPLVVRASVMKVGKSLVFWENGEPRPEWTVDAPPGALGSVNLSSAARLHSAARQRLLLLACNEDTTLTVGKGTKTVYLIPRPGRTVVLVRGYNGGLVDFADPSEVRGLLRELRDRTPEELL